MGVISLLVFALAVVAGDKAEDLRIARDLYAAAAYEEALTALTRVEAEGVSDVSREVGQYRVYCLFALGRAKEAETVAESLIRADPFARLDAEASPRIHAMFDGVRTRLLPALIQDEYRLGKAARASGNSSDAESHLLAARRLLDDARKSDVWNGTLADLAVLVDGFLDLHRAAQRTQTPPEPVAAQLPAVPAAARPSAPAPTAGIDTSQPHRFDSRDTDVSPPMAITQKVPSPPPQLLTVMRASRKAGLMEVLIDETGSVQQVVMRESVNPAYDGLVMAAARTWKYRPATRAGIPVPYLKTVAVTVDSRD